jgi:hypothetical protein
MVSFQNFGIFALSYEGCHFLRVNILITQKALIRTAELGYRVKL